MSLAQLIRIVVALATAIPFYTWATAFHGYETESWVGEKESNGIHVFRGIPFAEPPIDNLRWVPTRPYVPGAGEKSAREFAPACMRADHIENWYRDLIEKLGQDPTEFEGPPRSSEDCLYLNVWTPTLAPEARLPVMVWIHGGSNESGWSFEPDYHGSQLAARDVVVISVAYRLGAFSMFAHPELVKAQDGVAANYGLMDLVMALKWIQQHATAFGGDPGNVTLFGESAGAENIAALMASRDTDDLFHKAIHQSGPGLSNYTLDDIIEWSETLASGKTLTELRNLTADEFYEMQFPPSGGYAPVAGGHGLNAGDLYESVKPRRLLIGTNDHEWLAYLANETSLEETLIELDQPFTVQELRERLPDLPDLYIADRLSAAKFMYCPSLRLADRVSRHSGTYFYRFSRIREGEYGKKVGAYHGAEIPYVFGNHASYLVTTEVDQRLSDEMMYRWSEFARSGVPGNDWPGYDPVGRKTMRLDERSTVVRARDTWMCQ